MRQVLLALGLATFLPLCAAQVSPPVPPLNGDTEAVARLKRMLVKIGGRTTWASARGLYLHYRQFRSTPIVMDGEERMA